MAEGRSFGQLAGGGAPIPSLGAPVFGLRAQPTVAPVPNSVPAGAQTGAPPRSQFYSRLVTPASTRKATQLIAATPENRFFVITAPNIGGTVYIGGSDVTPLNGLALTPGLAYDGAMPGLQELWAVTDFPVFVRVQVQVSIVLMAEQGRPVGRIGNE